MVVPLSCAGHVILDGFHIPEDMGIVPTMVLAAPSDATG